MPRVRDDLPFEFPEHLRNWTPETEIDHFTFHRERCRLAPRRLKLAEITRMTDCDMCPDKGRGGPAGPRCRCRHCAERYPEGEAK